MHWARSSPPIWTDSEPEPAEIVGELVPASAAELVRDRGEPWPRPRTLDGGEDGAREAQVPRDERRWAGRRLERQPAVIADLVERAVALGEVDPPLSRAHVARRDTQLLHVDAANQLTERADLGRAVEAPPQRIREIEVAAEAGRAHALSQVPDLARGAAVPRSRG